MIVESQDLEGVYIEEVQFDSRKVQEGDLFVAIRGVNVDGHQYVQDAIAAGAAAVMIEDLWDSEPPQGVAIVRVLNTVEALAQVAKEYYDDPAKEMRIIGVTGTNGKTTVSRCLFQMYNEAGISSGLISTISYEWINYKEEASHTTPDVLKLYGLFAQMRNAGCSHVFMEVSSHALVQGRVKGVEFDLAVFTNLTRDHLDYHGTTKEYIRAKKLLFDGLSKTAVAIVNADDKRADIMVQNCKAQILRYALKRSADIKARMVSMDAYGSQIEMNGTQIYVRMLGEFNIYNLLCAYCVAKTDGWNEDEILKGISQLKSPKGRMELVENNRGLIPIIDYAHTPDALSNVLQTIIGFKSEGQKVITVVGCGGDRDKGKRPMMASVASTLSDYVIYTSDNPRSEDPEMIIDDMLAGQIKNNWRRIVDRRVAIREALEIAEKEDIILIAGKGHEEYQEISGERFHFSDREEVIRFVKK